MAAESVGTLLVFLVVVVALVLFVTEPIPVDVTVIGIMIAMLVLGPWTGISPREGVAGFSNPATITILAMTILSEGVRRTGAIKRLERAVGVVLGVVALAALDVVPVMVAALGGVLATIVAGIVKPAEAYEAVQWDVVLLLAGVIPLGTALSKTGGAELLGTLVASTGEFLPTVAVLGLFYLWLLRPSSIRHGTSIRSYSRSSRVRRPPNSRR